MAGYSMAGYSMAGQRYGLRPPQPPVNSNHGQ